MNVETAHGIMARCSKLVPEVSPTNGATILSHNVGLRPARRGGPRVEIEYIRINSEDILTPRPPLPGQSCGLNVIHAYGFGFFFI